MSGNDNNVHDGDIFTGDTEFDSSEENDNVFHIKNSKDSDYSGEKKR